MSAVPDPQRPHPEPRPIPVPRPEPPEAAAPRGKPPSSVLPALAAALLCMGLASFIGFKAVRVIADRLPGMTPPASEAAADASGGPAGPSADVPWTAEGGETPAEPVQAPLFSEPAASQPMSSPRPMLGVGEDFGGVADEDWSPPKRPSPAADRADKTDLVPYSLEPRSGPDAARAGACPGCPSAAASRPGNLDLSGMRRNVVVGSMRYLGECKGGYAYRIVNSTSRRLRLPLTNGTGELWNIDLPPRGSMTIRSRTRMPETPLVMFLR